MREGRPSGVMPIGYWYADPSEENPYGVICPQLPEWDKEKYPYAVICNPYSLRVYEEPCISYLDRAPKNTSKYMEARIVSSTSTHLRWAEFSEEEADTESGAVYGVEWTNHDIDNFTDGVALKAYNPKPIYLPFTFFEQEGATEKQDDCPYPRLVSGGYTYSIYSGNKVKTTINGEIFIDTAVACDDNYAYVGNYHLVNGDAEDDGRDWCAKVGRRPGTFFFLNFYTRTAGTYNIKMERIG